MTILQFPKDMKWGTATASYQIEGAARKDGRGPSIWDTFAKTPGNVFKGHDGDVACDSYHRFPEDVQLMKELGVDMYRFSIAWPRIFPKGTGEVNEEGLAYYHRLVDSLLDSGIEPVCTLYHWDLPQALQENGGWENRDTIDAFAAYAETIFRSFEGKIKKYLTINEPWCASFLSNYIGAHAPGKQSLQAGVDTAHHLMIAHGRAVQSFRALSFEGEIGYAPNVEWNEPYSSSEEDAEACRRATGWFLDWFFDPVFKGSYPEFLTDWFAKEGVQVPIVEGDLDIISQPIDFLGINYYTGGVARYQKGASLFDHERVDQGYEKTDIGWNIYPEGFYKILTKIHQQYGDMPIYITENGSCYNDEPVDGVVADDGRIRYLEKHLTALHRAIQSGVPIKGYMTWSLLDNFEWAEGYNMRFGLVHVNYRTLVRTEKESYFWYQQFLKTKWLEV
ncbi:GH1 family beta-glucosidase [Alkalicoccus daliensis]|uniref:Beta-glucosidase n=1 Tax=Alkalicoccus daliensis TaxID=745820 RepID=A0A1H0KB01_9BACI|nr:GH1 family beta-glucosidase [Alkalicoccus daliensis]SDO53127.1 broad-specificity cellobiase [Alkalicoccus daliensis]